MPVEINHCQLEFAVVRPRIKRAEELEARATFTNKSAAPIRLNTLFLPFASIMLRVRTAERKLVPSGPPPLPPQDEGDANRKVLRPGETAIFNYKGGDYFASPVPPGKYQVQFRYEQKNGNGGDWTGTLESPWIDFEIRP